MILNQSKRKFVEPTYVSIGRIIEIVGLTIVFLQFFPLIFLA